VLGRDLRRVVHGKRIATTTARHTALHMPALSGAQHARSSAQQLPGKRTAQAMNLRQRVSVCTAWQRRLRQGVQGLRALTQYCSMQQLQHPAPTRPAMPSSPQHTHHTPKARPSCL